MENNVEKIDLGHIDWKSSREFFDSLGEALDKLNDKDESYDFTWVGKRKSIIEAGAPINKTIRPDIKASKDFNNTKNMLIIGDNLDALKLLQESYLGKIKMIYIDPPYNTGSDFVYHDNFSIEKSEYSKQNTDSEGNVIIASDEFKENTKTNGRFHSDWLSMIYPRLKLARNLLSNEGVIFISIGEDEESNLRQVCNEVFGEENYITKFIWEKTQHFGRQKINCYNNSDYILCYAKDLYVSGQKTELLVEFVKSEFNDAPLYNASNPENNLVFPEGSVKFNLADGNYTNSSDEKYTLITPVTVENGWNKNEFTLRFKSRWSPKTVLEEVKKGTTFWIKSSNFSPRAVYADGKIFNESPRQIIFTNQSNPMHTKSRYGDKVGTSEEGSADFEKLGMKGFDYPKPVSLIKYLASLVDTEEDDQIFLDFFAGSGTTAQAIMELNSKDNKRRRFILTQLDEKIEGNSNYSSISQITMDRIRKSGEGISDDIDIGFRVFRIDDSNENEEARKPLDEIHQSNIFDMVENVKKDRTPLDLLFGVIYASALPFDLKLETRKISNNTIYLYGYLGEGTGLVACFDDEVSEEAIKEIAKLKTLTAAFKDSSFADSASKINLSEHFRIISPETKVKVL